MINKENDNRPKKTPPLSYRNDHQTFKEIVKELLIDIPRDMWKKDKVLFAYCSLVIAFVASIPMWPKNENVTSRPFIEEQTIRATTPAYSDQLSPASGSEAALLEKNPLGSNGKLIQFKNLKIREAHLRDK